MSSTVRIRGIAASPGIAIARAQLLDREQLRVPHIRIDAEEVELEIQRLRQSVEECRAQLEAANDVISHQDGPEAQHTLLLQAHLLMLQDETLIGGAVELIERDQINAEWAFIRKLSEIKKILVQVGDDYFRERTEDIDFVGERILRNLTGHKEEFDIEQTDPCVIVADRLSPIETAHMAENQALGFITQKGSRTSHTAIMAQALGIPAVVGAEGVIEALSHNDIAIIDGGEGLVILRPDEDTVNEYRERAVRYAELETRLRETRDEPSVTTDGVEISLLSNIEFPAEAPMSLDYGADGIGLYRTEFLYLDRTTPPSENEQCRTYKAVLQTMNPRRVIFRTFDIGSDKIAKGIHTPQATNPALGLRAVRLGLRHPELFKTQIRALLRSGQGQRISIMFPMISGVQELRLAKGFLEECRAELGDEGPAEVEVGCMIETPSSVMVADLLAKEVDFFSIGTNDLIQYSIAIDRGNDDVAYLYAPLHPGILRAIKHVVSVADEAGIECSLCGGMASEPLLAPVLIGLGLRKLSMAPVAIPMVKAMVRAISVAEAKELTDAAAKLNTAEEIEQLVHAHVDSKLNPDFPATPITH